MSGIKHNENVTEVVSIKPSPRIKSIPQLKELETPVIQTSASSENIIYSPAKMKKMLMKTASMKTTNQSLHEIQHEVLSTMRNIVPMVRVTSDEKAHEISVQISRIIKATSVADVIQTYNQVATACVNEHTAVFQTSIATTVKTVMNEVGFSNVKIKQLGITPVIIAKNNNGQTIRTEITETPQGTVNLVRIQSGISESECDSLNQQINQSLMKHGLRYNSFVKVEKPKEGLSNRTFDFSGETENNNQENKIIIKNK